MMMQHNTRQEVTYKFKSHNVNLCSGFCKMSNNETTGSVTLQSKSTRLQRRPIRQLNILETIKSTQKRKKLHSCLDSTHQNKRELICAGVKEAGDGERNRRRWKMQMSFNDTGTANIKKSWCNSTCGSFRSLLEVNQSELA